jgi:hypothetical protein
MRESKSANWGGLDESKRISAVPLAVSVSRRLLAREKPPAIG